MRKPLVLAVVAAGVAAVVARKRSGAKADAALWHEATNVAGHEATNVAQPHETNTGRTGGTDASQ